MIYFYIFSAVLEQERQRIEQLTAGWDDPTQVDWGAEEEAMGTSNDGYMAEVTEPSGPLLKCTALYSYTVNIDYILLLCRFCKWNVLGTKSGRTNDSRERTVGGGRRWRRWRLVESEKLPRRRRLRTSQLPGHRERAVCDYARLADANIILIGWLHSR